MKTLKLLLYTITATILLSSCYTARIQQLEQRVQELESEREAQRVEQFYAQYLEYGPSLELRHINFTRKGSRIMPSSYVELNELAVQLKKNKRQIIRIICHTDDLGSPQYNFRLSIKRLHAIKEYLTQKGVDQKQITTLGQGEFWPISETQTWDGRNENRRVEVQFAMR